METIRVTKVERRTGKTGKPYYQLTFEDGRKATSFDFSVEGMGGALVGVEFTQKGDFLNIKSIRMIARSDAPSDIGVPTTQPTLPKWNIDTPMKTNPVFPFLGACHLASIVMLDALGAGVAFTDSLDVVRERFSDLMKFSREMYETHMELASYEDTAKKLMD